MWNSLRFAAAALLSLFSGAAASAQPVVLWHIATGLDTPVDIVQTPIDGDQRLFVVEKSGTIQIIENGLFRSQPFLNIESKVTEQNNEQGLLGLDFHPDYGDGNDTFFINFSDSALGGDTAIERYSVSAGDPDIADSESGVRLLTINQDFGNHNGGQTRFGPDGYLYIGMGDGGSGYDPNCRAQDGGTLLGKMLRLDVDQNTETPPYYGIPASNPFAGPGEPLDEIFALGLRNPWRFSFDRETGDLWIADVGQGENEEINFVSAPLPAGLNFGWKVFEGTDCTNDTTNCPGGLTCDEPDSYTFPIFEYDTRGAGNCAVIGGYVYRGTAIPTLVGKYVYGDYCSGRIWAYDPATGANELIADADAVLLSFGELRNGEIVAAIGNDLYRLAPDYSGLSSWRVE